MEKETFTYTYSAPEQEEIRRIREKYLPKEKTADRLEQLKELDRKVERLPMMLAVLVGVTGTLIFGTGMALALSFSRMALGIVVGAIGFAILACALPVYNRILAKQKEKYGPEILKLAEELQK